MLTERQQMILNAIVDDYIRSAEPVGSRSISKRGDVNYSPATIRNEMADLEELGFLEQPHTSAGRIPSTKGYRYYVDHLSPVQSVNPAEVKELKRFFTEQLSAAEQMMQHAAMVLSHVTNYTSILLGPEVFHTSLRHFQLLPLEDQSAIAIMVTSTGQVENRKIRIPDHVSASELEQTVNLLNSRLIGVPLYKLKTRIFSEISEEMQRHLEHYEEMMAALDGAFGQEQEQKIFLSGATNMLIQPEFRDMDKVKSILDLLEETPTLTRLMTEAAAPQGIQVRIGAENAHEAFENCSLITATYELDGESLGTIGILGPTRMEYARVMGILNMLSHDMTRILKQWYR
ncbi:heat-inducible transcriptional repressor HrcA [Paenibacillus hunanensis]|uniref:Heat-inducible transcription repressor HrcA n=1 Tax=Paenibacillus hunanensis TaxID=539262 RepID=A0ABU1IYA0_9BACL|nr:heat-inducible transcriptional repressor HrcA [Paenibacillus hunanensis]MCL9660581.1 heat-inducible transcriptional repressor HrcA [Paenibacillus hunanensis]MDR6244144.1 heat-inducible transcriptional repressor [Paenibacillus hunanensis]WPP42774.1 heat-inducible transcriptional repressor HrcA [Paenibacillus hunanensis]GGJ19124.1 heat-inducible transcription repressor HrcA [Paenibacillus hunanensis]